MKKRLFMSFLLAMCFVVINANAQDTSDDSFNKSPYLLKQKKFTVAVQPLQLFNWGLRNDFEIRLGRGPGLLQFGTTVYYAPAGKGKENSYYYDEYEGIFRESFSGLKGGGLDINYKIFVNHKRTVYFATGVAYARFNIKYLGWTWDHYIEDGLQYHAYVMDYTTQDINRWGVNAYFGHQPSFYKPFLFDIFWGLGWRRSFSDSAKPSFDNYILSYGYNGIVFLTGVRIGFGFR